MATSTRSVAPRTPSPTTTITEAPLLLLFTSSTNGQARRAEGFISHILQRRHNHGSFRFRVIEQAVREDLFERFKVDKVPTIMVVDRGRIRRRFDGPIRPRQLEDLLDPWLR